MSVLAEPRRFTLREYRDILANPVKDNRYLDTAFGPTIQEWLSWGENEKGWSPHTLEAYRLCMARLAVMYPDKGPEDITKEDLRLARDSYPPASRNWAVGIYRSCFKWLYREERVERNVADLLDMRKRTAKKVHDVFTYAEQAQLLSNGPDTRYGKALEYRDRLAIAILLYAGVRRAELLALTVSDVDTIERRLIVRHGKGDKARVIPIAEDGELMRSFRFFLSTPLPRLERLPDDKDHILYSAAANRYGLCRVRTDRPLSDSAYHAWWRDVCERAGVRYRSGHTARHTLLTEVVREAGAERAQLIAGHASISTTVDTYSWLNTSDLTKTVDELERKRQAG